VETIFHFSREDDAEDEGLQRVRAFLVSMKQPPGMGTGKYKRLEVLGRDGVLGQPGKARMLPRRVVFGQEARKEILRQLHDESGHRGRDGIYEKASFRYVLLGRYL